MATKRKQPVETASHGARYPWETWFAAGIAALERGVDYQCSTIGMIANIRRAARTHGVRVSVDCSEDGQSLVLRVREEVEVASA